MRFILQYAIRVVSIDSRPISPTIRALRYYGAGTFSFGLDLLLLYALVTFAGVYYPIAVVISFLTAVSIHYTINRHWAFRGTAQTLVRGYAYFLLVILGTLAFVLITTVGLVEFFSLDVLIARIIASTIGGLWSFYANAKYNFKVL